MPGKGYVVVGKQTFLMDPAGRFSGTITYMDVGKKRRVWVLQYHQLACLPSPPTPSVNHVAMKVTFLKFSFLICKIKIRIGCTPQRLKEAIQEFRQSSMWEDPGHACGRAWSPHPPLGSSGGKVWSVIAIIMPEGNGLFLRFQSFLFDG